MNILILINDAAYGTEKAYNALRIAMAVQKDHPAVQVNVFLMADAVGCAIPNQNTPQGYYNIERMIKSILGKGGKIRACGTCMDARGLRSVQLIEGSEISNMAQLAQWTVEADKVFTF
jgi:uncharacterized protein involved in oxidation of intracellular sulfur